MNDKTGGAGRGSFLRRFSGGLLLGVCVLLPLLLSSLRAAVPVKFTYQGNLRQSGFLVTGQRAMVFRIYDSSDPIATELWTSPTYDVEVSTGVFRVTLEPVISDWQTGNLWMELEVEGTRLSPKEELTSSPFAVNSMMISGHRFENMSTPPASPQPGDLWFDTSNNSVNFWNGTVWVAAGGAAAPHAGSHSGSGSDPINSLGALTVTGALTLQGTLNPAGNLTVGGGGYMVTFASSVVAGWYTGNGSGLTNLNASRITSGLLSGDRIGSVISSTQIIDGTIQAVDLADGSVTKAKLSQSGCGVGQVLQWDGVAWVCVDGSVGGVEADPISIHNQDTLQAGATFYVSSGTVNSLNVNNSLKVMGTALIKGAPGQQGLAVDATGNVGVGVSGSSARFEVRGVNTQTHSLAIGVSATHQVVVSTSGAVGIGTETPAGKLEVTGAGNSGQYIAIFNSGTGMAAWLRNK